MPDPEVYWPDGTQTLGQGLKANALIGIAGRGGSGKSHLCYQLLTDPDYGVDSVLVLMAEDSTTTYRVEGTHIFRIKGLSSLDEVVERMIRAKERGLVLPKVVFTDSVSGIMDYQRRQYNLTPKLTDGGARDKRAEFGEMGYMGMDALIDLRDGLDCDVIAAVTTYEQAGALPEFAVEGKLLPKNFVRLTNVSLYLRAEAFTYVPYDERTQTGTKVKPHPWRMIDPAAGVYIDRYFNTQDSGEFLGKGHANLSIREPAYLPNVLRKIHGVQPREV